MTSVLKEADELVTTARQAEYGSPWDNHSLIAELWSPLLGIEVTPEQVALCMIQVKVAREVFKPKRDNRVDIAGYTKVLDMIVEKREHLTEGCLKASVVHEASKKLGEPIR